MFLSSSEMDVIAGEKFIGGDWNKEGQEFSSEYVDFKMSFSYAVRCQVSSWEYQFEVWERGLNWRYKIGSCPHTGGVRADLRLVVLKLMQF